MTAMSPKEMRGDADHDALAVRVSTSQDDACPGAYRRRSTPRRARDHAHISSTAIRSIFGREKILQHHRLRLAPAPWRLTDGSSISAADALRFYANHRVLRTLITGGVSCLGVTVI